MADFRKFFNRWGLHSPSPLAPMPMIIHHSHTGEKKNSAIYERLNFSQSHALGLFR